MIAPYWPATLPARQVRIARPTDQLDALVGFYRDGLGLPELERFTAHAGYRGVLLGLPDAEHHLEFTQHEAGSPGAAPSRDNLLVLSFDGPAKVRQVASRLGRHGHPTVAPENPYWAVRGALAVEDPDGWQVVLMPEPLVDRREPGQLRPVDNGSCDAAELKNMAVREDLQGRGRGSRLVRAALDLLATAGTHVLHVATAAADIANLRFYQLHGFRMRSVERDSFVPATGYPEGVDVAGIPLRDRAQEAAS